MGIVGSFVDGVVTATDDAATPNTATLALSQGDFSLDGLKPDGREATVIQSRGHVVGVRKGARALPTMKVNAYLDVPLDAFRLLVNGLTAGFVSTSEAIGDVPTTDITFTFTLGTDTKEIKCEDAHVTELSYAEGDPSSVSMTLEVLGPVSMTDTSGTVTYVSSR